MDWWRGQFRFFLLNLMIFSDWNLINFSRFKPSNSTLHSQSDWAWWKRRIQFSGTSYITALELVLPWVTILEFSFSSHAKKCFSFQMTPQNFTRILTRCLNARYYDLFLANNWKSHKLWIIATIPNPPKWNPSTTEGDQKSFRQRTKRVSAETLMNMHDIRQFAWHRASKFAQRQARQGVRGLLKVI